LDYQFLLPLCLLALLCLDTLLSKTELTVTEAVTDKEGLLLVNALTLFLSPLLLICQLLLSSSVLFFPLLSSFLQNVVKLLIEARSANVSEYQRLLNYRDVYGQPLLLGAARRSPKLFEYLAKVCFISFFAAFLVSCCFLF
jgi:hypothetical protein